MTEELILVIHYSLFTIPYSLFTIPYSLSPNSDLQPANSPQTPSTPQH